MCPQFIGFTPDKFLYEFVPAPTDSEGNPRLPPDFNGAFDEMMTDCDESQMYQSFLACIGARKLCPGFRFIAAESDYALDDDGRKKVDMCLINAADVPTMAGTKPLWSSQVMHIVFRTSDVATTEDPILSEDEIESEIDAPRRLDAHRQIISYAAELTARQHRTWLFTLTILGTDARLIRWDRAGGVVTNRFNYREDSSLAVFLWRFCHLSMEQQGYDPTATRLDAADPLIRRALTVDVPDHQLYIRDFFNEAISSEWPVYKLVVHHQLLPRHEASATNNREEGELAVGGDDSTGKESRAEISERIEHREYIVGKPKFNADDGITGRATRGYVAFDMKTEKFVWLKDVWRIASLHREGDIVHELNDVDAPYVPTLVCHGDVQRQRTLSQTFWTDPSEDNPMEEHIHYRLVVAEVGRQLDEFRNGLELVAVIRDCLIAHRIAYESLSILHQDISSGNILIIPEPQKTRDGTVKIVWRGMLNDWELCTKFQRSDEGIVEDSEPSQNFATGTWAFMSANLLQNGNAQHVLQDDLESFFHVLLYNAVTHLRSNCSDVPRFIAWFFDSRYMDQDDWRGGRGKLTAFRFLGIKSFGMNSLVFHPHQSPLNELLHKLSLWFSHRYVVLEARAESLTQNPDLKRKDVEWVECDREISDSLTESEFEYVPFNPSGVTLAVSERISERLSSHKLMIRLFHDLLKKRWPVDRFPNDVVKANKTPAVSCQWGTKRDNEAAGLDVGGGPSKRLKPSQSESASSRSSSRSQMKPRDSNRHNTGQTKSNTH